MYSFLYQPFISKFNGYTLHPILFSHSFYTKFVIISDLIGIHTYNYNGCTIYSAINHFKSNLYLTHHTWYSVISWLIVITFPLNNPTRVIRFLVLFVLFWLQPSWYRVNKNYFIIILGYKILPVLRDVKLVIYIVSVSLQLLVSL